MDEEMDEELLFWLLIMAYYGSYFDPIAPIEIKIFWGFFFLHNI